MKLQKKSVNGGPKLDIKLRSSILYSSGNEYKLPLANNGSTNKESSEVQSAPVKETETSPNSNFQRGQIATDQSLKDNSRAKFGDDVPKKYCSEMPLHNVRMSEETILPVVESSNFLEIDSDNDSNTDYTTKKKVGWKIPVQEHSSCQNLNVLTNSDQLNSRMTQHTKKVWLDNFKNSNLGIVPNDVLENGIKANEVPSLSPECTVDCDLSCNGVGDSMEVARSSVAREKSDSLVSEQNHNRKQIANGDSNVFPINTFESSNFAFHTTLKRRDSTLTRRNRIKKTKLTSSFVKTKPESKNNNIQTSITSKSIHCNLRYCYVKLEDINARLTKCISPHMSTFSSKKILSVSNPHMSTFSSKKILSVSNQNLNTDAKKITFSGVELIQGWTGWMSRIDHLKDTGLQVVSIADGSNFYQVLCSDDEDQSQSEQNGDWLGWATPVKSHITSKRLVNIFRTEHNITTDDENDICALQSSLLD